ncbi:MAG TPA: serine O-acetyltransferase [Rhizomicrobium sp.]|jgi:serine O-acetyltransferase|nr:serine O-acetyltransferase [Rhizomicrobium sp.]
MAVTAPKIATCDPIWHALREQAEVMAEREPALASLVHATVLKHDRLEDALSYHLAKKIGSDDLSPMMTREIFEEAMEGDPTIGEALRADLSAVFERDPACKAHLEAFLFYKGLHALETHRVAHWLWHQDRHAMARYFQSQISEKFGVDIHPAARMGKGIMIDHATGVVIGETTVVEDDVSIMQGVTLGGTGKEEGDRHPKVRRGVLISLGAKILGNIEIGEYSRVGAGSVVLQSVPPGCTAVGVPARLTNCAGVARPSQEMNQLIEFDDKSG